MNSRMRMCLAGLTTATLIVSAFAGCSSVAEDVKEAEAVDETVLSETGEPDTMTEIQAAISPPKASEDSDAVLFVVTSTNEGPFSWGNNYIENTTYTVYYNGSLEIVQQYSITGERTTFRQLADEDFLQISEDMEDAYAKQPWNSNDYSDYMDGFSWGFSYYERSGREIYIYGGYTDGCTALEEVEETLKSYEEELTDTALIFDECEGYYFYPDNVQAYLNIYRDSDGEMWIEMMTPESEEPEFYHVIDLYMSSYDETVSFCYEKPDGTTDYLTFTYIFNELMNGLQVYDGDLFYASRKP